MKYKKEIDAMFRQIFGENLTDEELITLFESNGETYEKLADKIDIGIKNGYSLETQMNIIKSFPRTT